MCVCLGMDDYVHISVSYVFTLTFNIPLQFIRFQEKGHNLILLLLLLFLSFLLLTLLLLLLLLLYYYYYYYSKTKKAGRNETTSR
jgi:uncharacterized membrane protein YqjE